jgi:threonine synthase
VDDADRLPFAEILLAGLAPDGGLYTPEAYPQVSPAQLGHWRDLLETDGYPALAAAVLGLFADDYAADGIVRMAEAAYTAQKFGAPEIVPVSPLGENLWLAHLANGPTAAFKDLAMQMLGELFDYELTRRDTSLTVLGATSGDTGSSAEHAMLGRERVKVAMLTPRGRMTPFQQAQMYSIDDPAIANLAVDGVFDDCQDLVKAVNLDAAFKARWRLGAVNSINWGRVAAQIVYYFAAYLKTGEARVSFAVPTGNFGNILAGHVAREMGLPIDALILATNENDVLHQFFSDGVYRPRGAGQTFATSSPSMDISKASNFERFVYDLVGRDGTRVRELFGEALPQHGFFDLSGSPEFATLRERYGFVSARSTHAARVAAIRRTWQEAGCLVDPHTADAVHAASVLGSRGAQARRGHGAGAALAGADPAGGRGSPVSGPIVVLETALPVKFAETIVEAVGFTPPVPRRFAHLADAPRHAVEMPNDPETLKAWLAGWLGD